MSRELEMTYQVVKQAQTPEAVFGSLKGSDKESQSHHLNNIYRQMAKVLHPDLYQQDLTAQVLAQEAFPLLSNFYDRAQQRLEKGIYGTDQPDEVATEADFVITTYKQEYHFRSVLAQGDLATIYKGDYVDVNGKVVQIVAKVIDDLGDNDLAQNELKVLRILLAQQTPHLQHLPVLLDQFKTTDRQQGIILKYFNGYDLTSVRDKYREGVPEKHMVWMLNRLLTIVGYAHSRGVIHGNIEPTHVMIRPKDHNLKLIDWSYAAVNPFQTGDSFKILNEEYSAPEVAQRKSPIPASDLYSIGKCMIYLLGGDVPTNSLPPQINDRIKRLIKFMVLVSPLQRAQDAWQLRDELRKLIIELWGERKFLEFKM